MPRALPHPPLDSLLPWSAMGSGQAGLPAVMRPPSLLPRRQPSFTRGLAQQSSPTHRTTARSQLPSGTPPGHPKALWLLRAAPQAGQCLHPSSRPFCSQPVVDPKKHTPWILAKGSSRMHRAMGCLRVRPIHEY